MTSNSDPQPTKARGQAYRELAWRIHPKPMLFTAALLTAGMLGFARWTNGQATADESALDPMLEKELADLALQDPIGFAAEMEKYRTPEDHQIQYVAHLGMTNPAAYFHLFPKTQQQIQEEEIAGQAIAHPLTVDQVVSLLTPAERLERGRAMDAILNPPNQSDVTTQ